MVSGGGVSLSLSLFVCVCAVLVRDIQSNSIIREFDRRRVYYR